MNAKIKKINAEYEKNAAKIAELTGKPFRTAANKFHALTSKDEIVFAHGAVC